MGDREAAEYVIPLRWRADDELAEMTSYLRQLAAWIDVTVVDGSALVAVKVPRYHTEPS